MLEVWLRGSSNGNLRLSPRKKGAIALNPGETWYFVMADAHLNIYAGVDVLEVFPGKSYDWNFTQEERKSHWFENN